MKLGLIARADDRGIGTQTLEFFRNMAPDKVLVVIPGTDITNGRDVSGGFRQHPEWFSGAPWSRVVTWNPGEPAPRQLLHDFCDGLDAIYLVETPYWFELYDIARRHGTRTINHANPEFFRHVADPALPRPDEVWLPSTWLTDQTPHTRVMPYPVDRRHVPYRPRTEARTFLHVVGRRAVRDRNGTHLVYKAFRRVRVPVEILIRSQDKLPHMHMSRNVRLTLRVEDVEDYADLYSTGDVLILPRRFGGLSLPMNEALSSGMPVLMTDCSPQSTFLPPEMLVLARPGPALRTQAGFLPVFDVRPDHLAQRIDALANDPAEVERLSKEADRLAESISWDALKPSWVAAFSEPIDMSWPP